MAEVGMLEAAIPSEQFLLGCFLMREFEVYHYRLVDNKCSIRYHLSKD
jgi:hypothetical protein